LNQINIIRKRRRKSNEPEKSKNTPETTNSLSENSHRKLVIIICYFISFNAFIEVFTLSCFTYDSPQKQNYEDAELLSGTTFKNHTIIKNPLSTKRKKWNNVTFNSERTIINAFTCKWAGSFSLYPFTIFVLFIVFDYWKLRSNMKNPITIYMRICYNHVQPQKQFAICWLSSLNHISIYFWFVFLYNIISMIISFVSSTLQNSKISKTNILW